MQPKHITAAVAAAALNCSARTIERHCLAAGIGERVSRMIILEPADVDRLRELVRPAPGNPHFGKPKHAERSS